MAERQIRFSPTTIPALVPARSVLAIQTERDTLLAERKELLEWLAEQIENTWKLREFGLTHGTGRSIPTRFDGKRSAYQAVLARISAPEGSGNARAIVAAIAAEAGKPYTCARCKGEYLSKRPDDEALAEAEEIFDGPIPVAERETLCDGCWQEFMAWFESLSPADHERIRAEEARQ